MLLADLAALDLASGRVGLSVLIVDNASAEPLSAMPAPEALDVRHLRLEDNRGGSGGFSRGMDAWLESGIFGDPHEFLWLLDSDARLDPGALLPLVEALARHPELAGVGSALADPVSGEVFEVGGEVDPRTGEFVQLLPRDWARREVIPAGYIAACSLLVRRTAVEAAGVMADLFLNGDDVEWCYRISRRTGLGFAAVTASRAFHPHPSKMRTVGRYYAARNAPFAMAAAGVTGRLPRFRRAMREVGRAACQVMMGRGDLGELHLRGLRDARLGVRGRAAKLEVEPFRPLSELDGAIKEAMSTARGRVLLRPGVVEDAAPLLRSLNAVCVAPDMARPDAVRGVWGAVRVLGSRLIGGPRYGVAGVSARGWPEDWLIGRVVVSVAPGGFCVCKVGRLSRLMALSGVLIRGVLESVRLGLAAPQVAASRDGEVGSAGRSVSGATIPTLSIVLLSYNRWAMLERTLTRLGEDSAVAGAEVIVVDNGSMDGTPERVRSTFPLVKLVALRSNVGVAAFNEGVRASSGEAVLILDDDSWPAAGVLGGAMELLAKRPEVAAVSLHPRHPQSQRSEWGFAERVGEAGVSDEWPVMGCGNLVRRTAWDRVGGYEESFFLYRNDVDLAMKLIDAGYRVHFDPKWTVWHDSPGAVRKSSAWFRLATRNWVWLCRRHGRGRDRLVAIVAGWGWAHRLAGWSVGAHVAVIGGVLAGVLSRRPRKPVACVGGRGMREYLRVRFGRGRVAGAS